MTILARKANNHSIGRLLAHLNGWWIVGIIGGNMFLLEEYIPLFFLMVVAVIGIVFYSRYYGAKAAIYMGASLLLSTLLLMQNPLHYEADYLTRVQQAEVKGRIKEVNTTEYNKYLILENVILIKDNEKKQLKTNIQVVADPKQDWTVHDEVQMKVKYSEVEPQMNPSDFNYTGYIKGKNISGLFKMTSLISKQKYDPLSERLLEFLKKQINKLYYGPYAGIMKATLLGDNTAIESETKALYNEAGIGHLLCISGFHVGVIMTLITAVLSMAGLSYSWKFFLAILGIGGYTYLTGNNISTVRAALMLSVMLIGRCLWREEDTLTSLALACWLILLHLPYQLFQAGFQLSFLAVLGIFLMINEIEKQEGAGIRNYQKWQKTLMITAAIQLATWPILAYHFYEVPFLISLLNLAVIPVFSVVILVGWMSLGLFLLHIPLGVILAKGIELVLGSIEYITDKLLKVPLAVLCTGRPQIEELALFIAIVILTGACYFRYIRPQIFCKGLFILSFAWTGWNVLLPSRLSISMLYVGQGDGLVIETPHHQLMVIDGGNFGKGKVMEDYIKYKGYRLIEAMFVSHSDADHIGGLIELLQTNIRVNTVFISSTDESELLQQFIEECRLKDTQVYRLKKEDTVCLEDLRMTCLAPVSEYAYSDANNNSMVLLLQYNQFKAVFTGDKEKGSDFSMYDGVGAVSLLKISHHGSRTGTSEELLLKLAPRYAMMSCGRNNMYGHPHAEVLDLLRGQEVPVSRTDQNGTIWYETNGYDLKETKYRKDD